MASQLAQCTPLHRYSESLPSAFHACFVLKVPFQKGEGEKKRGCKISTNKSPETMAEALNIGVDKLYPDENFRASKRAPQGMCKIFHET